MTQVEPGSTAADGVTVAAEVGVTSDNWGSVLVYCDEAAAPDFLVRNTSVLGGRRWGMLIIEAHDGTVTGCTFANTSAEALMIVNGETDNQPGHLGGGFVARNLSIINNKFLSAYVQGPCGGDCKSNGAGRCAAQVSTAVVGSDAARHDSGLQS